MATFNPSNGCILASSQGTVCPLDPKYSNIVNETQQSGNIKTVGRIVINATIRDPATAISSNVPAIQQWTLPGVYAVVYTDTNGNSSFSYKNDPQGIIKLVPGGSQAVPIEEAVNLTSSTQESSGGGILGFICWCLSCMSSIGFISLIGFIVFMALKKQP
jgi:hypothetical protein